MKKPKKYIAILFFTFSLTSLLAGKYNFAGLPVLDFNSDKGLSFGGSCVVSYKDQELHKPYTWSVEPLVEWSTKGQRKIRIFFDSPFLISDNIRFSVEYENNHDKFHPYYGLNGFTSYDEDLIEKGSDTFINERVYNFVSDKNRLNIITKTSLPYPHLKFVAALGYNKYVNDLKEDSSKVEIDYENGFISKKELNGGMFYSLRSGLSYDSRNDELNPSKGIWSELILTYSPKIITSDFEFGNLLFMFNHYRTIVSEKLILAQRIMYRHSIGNEPFFSLTEFYPSYKLVEGMGGAKSLRGIYRNRLSGIEQLFSNIELRFLFWQTELYNQSLDWQILVFSDIGVVNPFKGSSTSLSHVPDELMKYYKRDNDYRITVGCGGRVNLNKSFIAGIDAGVSKEDGLRLYFSMGHLF